MYAGVQFRSRLEARWAAFFDLVGWRWEYEPIDLDGYIPDFVLQFKVPILVEVKPIVRWPCAVAECQDPRCFRDPMVAEAIEKIRISGWKDEAILVGATQPVVRWMSSGFMPLLGRFAIEYWGMDDARYSAALGHPALFSCAKCGNVSLCSAENAYACRINGCWDGDRYLDAGPDFVALWREAGNRVQWRAPELRP